MYDGVLGVLGGIEALAALKRAVRCSNMVPLLTVQRPTGGPPR